MNRSYDIIIIGAGSVGTPLSYQLAKEGFSVCVIEKEASFGQGENKAAIGGIRATHTEEAKIYICQESLDIFSNWKETCGDDLGWKMGGYTYPVYTLELEKTLKNQVKLQKDFGLKIDYIGKEDMMELIPRINSNGLLGGTYSPEDGSASPIQSAVAFYKRAKSLGVSFSFRENVRLLKIKNQRIAEVITDKNRYSSSYVINASGSYASDLGKMAGVDLPVVPDCHEAGITEPVQCFFRPMVVDMRKTEDSSNFYFYQSETGQIVFCITPDPPVYGVNSRSTSSFLPMVSKRMVELYPRLMNIRVRRVWRGQYPNTPDGFPIIDFNRDIGNLINVVGMCGQGFMMGPGLAAVVSRKISGKSTEKDNVILRRLRLDRDYSGKEEFK